MFLFCDLLPNFFKEKVCGLKKGWFNVNGVSFKYYFPNDIN